jgi:hypothetical protein
VTERVDCIDDPFTDDAAGALPGLAAPPHGDDPSMVVPDAPEDLTGG